MPASTKLGCTLGPESRSIKILEQLLQAGMTVCNANVEEGVLLPCLPGLTDLSADDGKFSIFFVHRLRVLTSAGEVW